MRVTAWTRKHLEWVKREVHFEQLAQQVTLQDYVHEVEHATGRVEWLERAVGEAVESAPPRTQEVIEALRGIAQISAVPIVVEVGEVSRFQKARQPMGYSGMVASEHSSGERTWRGRIAKTGNAHLRRVIIKAAWAYRHQPWVGGALRKRQERVSGDVKEIAWKAQHRLHARFRKLAGRGKNKQQIVTAMGRELLGFIWAIGVTVEGRMGQEKKQAV